MTGLRIRTASRLHFGLLTWGTGGPRQFGGVGLMIDRPGLALAATPSDSWRAEGPLADRTLALAESVAGQLAVDAGQPVGPLAFRVDTGAREHAGLGAGTQLSLAVARLVARHAGRGDLAAADLAALTGRGRRSGIGLHGFDRGGLIVDGGRRGDGGVPPLVAHHEFPADWRILIVIPPGTGGLHGSEETGAFAKLPASSEAVSDRLCRLVLLGLLPAVAERDLDSFGAALTAIQFHVGRSFAPVQGGLYARPDLEPIVNHMRGEGLVGVGQSSWGPTLYGFARGDRPGLDDLAGELRARFGLGPHDVFWTSAASTGARVDPVGTA